MTTITFNNRSNISLTVLKNILTSLELDVIKIENDDELIDIPNEHWESIKEGREEIKLGKGIDNKAIHKKALELCSK